MKVCWDLVGVMNLAVDRSALPIKSGCVIISELQLGQNFNGGKLALVNIYSAGEVKQSPNSLLEALMCTFKKVDDCNGNTNCSLSLSI